MDEKFNNFVIYLGVIFLVISTMIDGCDQEKEHKEIKTEIKSLSIKVDSLIKVITKK